MTCAPSGGETTTAFIWAAAGAASWSGRGQCVWADRPARGSEIQPGGYVISRAMQSVPAGTFVEVGVARDPLVNNCVHLARYIGTVSLPFSALPALPPFVQQSIASLTPAQSASLQHGIEVMMSRPASDPTGYRFQANIHGTYVISSPFEPPTSCAIYRRNAGSHGGSTSICWRLCRGGSTGIRSPCVGDSRRSSIPSARSRPAWEQPTS